MSLTVFLRAPVADERRVALARLRVTEVFFRLGAAARFLVA